MLKGIYQSFVFYLLNWTLEHNFYGTKLLFLMHQQKCPLSYHSNSSQIYFVRLPSMHHANNIWQITFYVNCSCLEKSALFTNSISYWQMICIITVSPTSQVCLCYYTPHSTHPQMLPYSSRVQRLMPFWITTQRSIYCLLKTTGHNKWIILFTIKAPVPKWIDSTNVQIHFPCSTQDKR